MSIVAAISLDYVIYFTAFSKLKKPMNFSRATGSRVKKRGKTVNEFVDEYYV